MTVTQAWPTWVRRLSFAAVLLVAAITPGTAAGWSSQLCQQAHCERAGIVRWIRPLPWPHYFVDLSGIGGSAPPDQDAVLLAICGQVATQTAGAAAPRCARPELAVLNR